MDRKNETIFYIELYVNIRKGMLLSRTNFAMMSNIMLMFLLLLFLAGDVEKKRGPMGTPV
jgi:hypothetical protein